ncbi:hypothetical protein [Kluyvera ascorbata]|uniref:hypothetical protein n=1 Tax=Kluyvera ascorbata TaxID=51288 RepID=UPI0029066375|nr:hypothetical protein [Kluyvera ascorbata]MDU3912070.1 hypothetical protein [Kluyvera ascorbata]
MKEFKGTPGKWSFSHGSASDDNVACIEINSSESLHEIAYLQSTPSSIGKYEQTSFDKTIANAHLIAAAPDLLEALSRLEVSVNTIRYCWGKRPENMCMAMQQAESDCDSARAAISKALGKE